MAVAVALEVWLDASAQATACIVYFVAFWSIWLTGVWAWLGATIR